MKRIIIINGPNLNLLGLREPDIYGRQRFEDYLDELRDRFAGIATIDCFQSNLEGALINKVQETCYSDISEKTNSESLDKKYDGIVINAGGYGHTSISLRDAISAIPIPVIEVHISNIFAREEFRQHSMIAGVCKGSICGLGLEGYAAAVGYLTRL